MSFGGYDSKAEAAVSYICATAVDALKKIYYIYITIWSIFGVLCNTEESFKDKDWMDIILGIGYSLSQEWDLIVFFWVYICSCFGGWFSFAGCNQHFCNASVCRLFVYQKSQLWQPGGTPSPATPSLYRLPMVLVSIFNLIFPAAISLCLLWLRFFLTFNFLSFLPCFFFLYFDAWQDAFDRRRVHLHKPIQNTDMYISCRQDIRMQRIEEAHALLICLVFCEHKKLKCQKLWHLRLCPMTDRG